MKTYLTGLILTALILLPGCVTQTVRSTSVAALETPAMPIAEDELLDIGVAIFDPNLEQVTTDQDVPIFAEVRRAEATFMAGQLTQVLQDQNAWGAVRIVPDDQQFTDLLVRGKILKSDGEQLSLAIRVTDATGREWINKTYSGTTSVYAYNSTARANNDPFVGVYRDIANDLLKRFNNRSRSERIAIRRIAEMRFARDFSADAFGPYLNQNDNGIYSLTRLPAENDPMLERVRTIRGRNYVFVDTLQGHYSGFSDDITGPYDEWRKASYEETIALRELRAEAQRDMILGGLAVIAGVAAQGSGSEYTQAAGAVGVIAGGYLLKGGLEKRASSEIHALALEEIGQSLEAEVTPRVIELEDRTVRLSGSVEDQYHQWRELLADIYAAEMRALEEPDLAE